jgi:hypothetical protein
VTDETLWTDPEDPTLSPYRRSKTVAERAAWDLIVSYERPNTLTTILPVPCSADHVDEQPRIGADHRPHGSKARCLEAHESVSRSWTCATLPMSTSGR